MRGAAVESRVEQRWAFEPDPSQVSVARRHVRDALLDAVAVAGSAWVEGWVDTAEVAVSELVTNALVHGGTPVELLLLVGDDAIRVDVCDGSSGIPRPRSTGGTPTSGRGLALVAELVTRWGVEQSAAGKSVWFELDKEPTDTTHSAHSTGRGPRLGYDGGLECDRGVGERTGRTRSPDDAAAAATTQRVVLREVPLLLHAAWQEQAAAMLREYLLSGIVEDLDVLERHAAASTAMSLLVDQLPPPSVTLDSLREDPRAADLAALTADEVALEIPTSRLVDFQVLDELLDEAIWSARANALDTPPILAEVASMRRWICSEIREQAQGRTVSYPWRLASLPPQPDWSAELEWPVETVTEAPDLRVAVSDDGFVVAASPAADAALADRWPEGVRGRRFISLVPATQRQLLLAAFTLQLATEHGLTDGPIQLRDLGVDGRYESWLLAVDPVRSANGPWILVARLHPSG